MNRTPLNRRLARTLASLASTAGACAIAFACLAAVPEASAQVGRRAVFTEAFRPDIMQRDATMMVDLLQLEEWQRPVLDALIADYATSFGAGVQAMQEQMRTESERLIKEGNTNNEVLLTKIMEPMSRWRDEKRRMYDKFVEDVRSQLGQQQAERWPKVERALRRDRLLPEGDLSGESVNLWTVIARMQPTPTEEEAMAAALEAYELALDAALQTRQQRTRDLTPALEEAMAKVDYDRQSDVQDGMMVGAIAVRDANDAAIETLAAAMGERGAAFRRQALDAGYQEVFRIHPVMVQMQQAGKIDSLTDDQRAQIDALMVEFGPACDEANMRLLDVVRAEEPKAHRRRNAAAKERKGAGASSAPGTRPDDPIAQARTAKERMGDPWRERLLAILSEEQKAELVGGGRTPLPPGAAANPQMSDAERALIKGAGVEATNPGKRPRTGSQQGIGERSGKGNSRKGDGVQPQGEDQ